VVRVVMVLLVGLVVAVAFVVVMVHFSGGPMSRARVETFARRQRLTVTTDNGNQVIRYLAVTRRWRVAGFVGGFLASQLTAPDQMILYFGFIPLFAGWFLGALIAEVRVSHLSYGRLRAASLQPRRLRHYLRPTALAAVPVAAAVSLAIGVGTAVAAALDAAAPDWTAWAWLSLGLGTAAAVRTVQLRIVGRPQPLADPDVLAGDDAIRSRSLHVLSGGGAALVLLIALTQLGAAHVGGSVAEQTVEAVQALGTFVVALIGWLIATSLFPPRGPLELPGNAPAAGAT
jgi:hypothetical protein